MRRLMWFSLGFACACLTAIHFLPLRTLPWYGAGAVGLSAAAMLLCRRRTGSGQSRAVQGLRILSAVLLGLSLGLIRFFLYDTATLSPARTLVGKKQTIDAELCAFPQKTERAWQAEALLDPDGSRVRTRLYLYGSVPALRPGDRISGVFTIRSAEQNADGSANLSLPARGILLTGSGQISTVEDGGDPLRYFPARLSHAAFLRLGDLIPSEAAGLPQAMLTGDRSGLSAAKQDVLSTAGVSHIIAVSGLHVAMLFSLLLLLLGNRGWLTAICSGLMLTLYCLMTGASPSVLRASLMLGLLLAAPLLREENDPPTALALAALAILLGNPSAIVGLSFQLSFAAVAGLLLVGRPVQEALLNSSQIRAVTNRSGFHRLPRGIRVPLLHFLGRSLRFMAGCFSATLGALVFTTPISAAAFGTVPVYGILTNLPVLPLASVCLGGALPVLALGLLGTAAGRFAGSLLAFPVRAIFDLCRLVSRLPGSRLSMDFYGIAFLLFLYALLLLALYAREKRVLRPIATVFAALFLAVWFQQRSAACSSFTLAALDVGQGQCVCILTPEYTAVVDCGGSGGSSAGTEAALWLRQHGIQRLDALILTHYDSDHISGVTTLLELMPTSTVYLPEVPFKPEQRAELEASALQWGTLPQSVGEDVTIPLSGGVLRLFAPVSEENDNAACVSILFSIGEYDMLISGDLDVKAERALLERHALPHVELYIAGHHGSARSSSEELLQTIRPDTVFISVGRNSNYGLPSEKALKRLEACGAAIYRTDQCGNLEIGR